MNTCYSCRHWDRHVDNLDWGECELAYSYGNKPDEPETLAFATVGSMVQQRPRLATLRTNKDFGCNQFVEDN